MNYLRIRDDADRAELETAMLALRGKQRGARLTVIVDAIGDDLDELLEMWARSDGQATAPNV